ncbi:MAG: helix-turn-helix domain-containing protein [Pseudomonadales bacterium]|jgi:transcriptional regulator with XRE-family HTH domain|nr:helix-turn-helix domain-containing protein [Pseudomonadales bacterium]
MKTIGEIISLKRKEKNMTQAELAEKMHVTDKAVSKWERDLSCPDINSISKLAEILEISVDELLNAKKPNAKNTEVIEIVSLILKAVPLAMGIGVVAISILGELDVDSAIRMIGIGLTCLSLGALSDKERPSLS